MSTWDGTQIISEGSEYDGNYYITRNLADAFIQSDLQLIRTKQETYPLEQCGVKGLTQGAQQLCRSYRGHNRDRTTDLAGPSQVA